MSVIYSEIRETLPGDWSVILPPTETPAIGDFWERQVGTGVSSKFVISVYTISGWVDLQTIAQ